MEFKIEPEVIVGHLNAAIRDGETNNNCLSEFRDRLKELGKKDPSYIAANFSRIKENFRAQLWSRMPGEGDQKRADSLEQLYFALSQIEKADAIKIITLVRQAIHSHFEERDRTAPKKVKKPGKVSGVGKPAQPQNTNAVAGTPGTQGLEAIKDRLDAVLTLEQLEFISSCIIRQQPKAITTFGADLPPEQRLEFFEIMSDLFPLDEHFAKYFAFNAAHLGTSDQITKSVERILLLERNAVLRYLPAIAKIIKGRGDKAVAAHFLALIEDKINRPPVLTAYSSLARTVCNNDHVGKAVAELEKNLSDTTCIVEYGTVARYLRDKEKIESAMILLEGRSHDDYALNTYALLAKELNDWQRMNIALQRLEKRVEDNPHSLGVYAQLAITCRDEGALKRAFRLLESQKNNPLFAEHYHNVLTYLTHISEAS